MKVARQETLKDLESQVMYSRSLSLSPHSLPLFLSLFLSPSPSAPLPPSSHILGPVNLFYSSALERLMVCS